MKRVILAIAILLIIPVLIFVTHNYLKRSTDSMILTIESAEKLAGEGKKNEAAQQVTAFQKKWYHSRIIMSTFIRHAEVDIANQAAAKLEPYLEEDQLGEFNAEGDSLVYQLHHIWETEKFSIDNVL